MDDRVDRTDGDRLAESMRLHLVAGLLVQFADRRLGQILSNFDATARSDPYVPRPPS